MTDTWAWTIFKCNVTENNGMDFVCPLEFYYHTLHHTKYYDYRYYVIMVHYMHVYNILYIHYWMVVGTPMSINYLHNWILDSDSLIINWRLCLWAVGFGWVTENASCTHDASFSYHQQNSIVGLDMPDLMVHQQWCLQYSIYILL